MLPPPPPGLTEITITTASEGPVAHPSTHWASSPSSLSPAHREGIHRTELPYPAFAAASIFTAPSGSGTLSLCLWYARGTPGALLAAWSMPARGALSDTSCRPDSGYFRGFPTPAMHASCPFPPHQLGAQRGRRLCPPPPHTPGSTLGDACIRAAPGAQRAMMPARTVAARPLFPVVGLTLLPSEGGSPG